MLQTGDGGLVICDFGSATTDMYDLSDRGQWSNAEEEINNNTTLLYRAPEMLDFYRKQIVDTKVDIWVRVALFPHTDSC